MSDGGFQAWARFPEKTKKIVLVGAGDIARLACDYFDLDSPYEVVAFAVHERFKKDDTFMDRPLVTLEKLLETHPPDEFHAFAAVGFARMSREREAVVQELLQMGYELPTYISSLATVAPSVKFGRNCFIMETTVLQPHCTLGDGVMLWGTLVGHEAVLEDYVMAAGNTLVCGLATVGRYSFLGASSTVLDGIKVAKDTLIGGGVVVPKPTEPGQVLASPRPEVLGFTAYEYHKIEADD